MVRFFIILFTVIQACATNCTADELGSEQIDKLVKASLKQAPSSMDITFFKTIKDMTKDQADFQKLFDDAFNKLYGPRENLSDSEVKVRDQAVQLNVQRQLMEKEAGRTSKMRIRYTKDRQRIDYVNGISANTILKDLNQVRTDSRNPESISLPYTKSVIEISDMENANTLREYLHETKAIYLKKIKTKNTSLINEILGFAKIPDGMADVLKMKISHPNNQGEPRPDEAKLELLRSGHLSGLRLSLDPCDTEGPNHVRIEMVLSNTENIPFLQMAMICDKEDYARVYVSEIRQISTGNLVRSETRSNFDSQGFPHKISVDEYDSNGNLTRQYLYQIENVSLNVLIPPKDFQIDGEKEYRVIDRDNSFAEQKEQQIARFREWIKDDDWKRRLQGIAGLKELLKGRPEELRDIAAFMLNDENPNIRKLAEQIIRSIESDK